MDRFKCAECGEFFYYDMELDGVAAEPGEKVAIACPICEHPWSSYQPDEL